MEKAAAEEGGLSGSALPPAKDAFPLHTQAAPLEPRGSRGRQLPTSQGASQGAPRAGGSLLAKGLPGWLPASQEAPRAGRCRPPGSGWYKAPAFGTALARLFLPFCFGPKSPCPCLPEQIPEGSGKIPPVPNV